MKSSEKHLPPSEREIFQQASSKSNSVSKLKKEDIKSVGKDEVMSEQSISQISLNSFKDEKNEIVVKEDQEMSIILEPVVAHEEK